MAAYIIGSYIFGDYEDDYLVWQSGIDTIYGSGGNDLIYGNPNNTSLEWLNGGTGNDKIVAGGGNDVLFGDTGNDGLEGGNGADKLYGGPGNDILNGGAGNDRLAGGVGNDRLTGGGGKDTFVLGLKSDDKDVITDFLSGVDKFDLPFKVTAENLVLGVGVVAQDVNDRILFDTNSGALYYDKDGTGSALAQHIATLENAHTVTVLDFV